MSWLNNVGRWLSFRSIGAGATHLKDPVLIEMFGGRSTKSGAVVTPLGALQVSAVYSCVSLLSESVAMLPLTLYKRLPNDGREPATKHYLYRLLKRKPNRFQTTFDWLQMTVAHVLLRGNAYSEIIFDNGGRVSDLMPRHPDRVKPFLTSSGQIAYGVKDTPTSEYRIVYAEEMLHFRDLGDDVLQGQSRISLHKEAIGLAMKTEEHGARIFSNGAQVGGVLEIPGRLKDKESVDRLRTQFAERQAGSANVGKPLILEDGMKWTKLGMTADESQFLQTRQYQRSEIASIFRVPPHMIGDTDKATSWGSGIEQQGIGFVTFTLLPMLVKIEQQLENKLFLPSEEERLFIKLPPQALMRGDSKSRAEYLSKMVERGILTRNEARSLEEYNALDGLDLPLTPVNLTVNLDPPNDNTNNGGA